MRRHLVAQADGHLERPIRPGPHGRLEPLARDVNGLEAIAARH